MTSLRSPVDGSALAADTAWSLRDGGGRRWPVADGVPFLRVGRERLAADALARLDAGEADEALVLLLADQDDWWTGPPADPERLRRLVRDADRLTFREAMDHLGFGPVAVYFAHRWTDPTFLAGLALMEAHWPEPAPASAFELACGAGHYLRELARRGVRCTGGDVVFAKLWLARRWIAPEAELVCFDAAAPWPIAERRFGLALCHDAFYFLEPKADILRRLRAAASRRVVAHVHNRDWPNLSAGSALSAAEVAAMFPHACVYDDAELTRALAEHRAPRHGAPESLTGAEAFSIAEGFADGPRAVEGRLALPPEGAPLRRNPLYQAGALTWPSERYAREYGPRATYPERTDAPEEAPFTPELAAMARRRELVDLPERW